jgi:hypothetical protein
MSDRFTATVCGLAFAGLFASNHTLGPGMEFLTPYSHVLTHGVVMSLGMLLCLRIAHETRRARWMIGAGFIFGCVALTKAEVFLAAAAGAGAYFAIEILVARRVRPVLLLSAIAASIPVLVALFALSRAMPMTDAARGILGAWLWVGDAQIRELPFFRWVMGTDDLARSLTRMFGWLAAYALLIGASCAIALKIRSASAAPIRRRAAIAVGLTVAAPLAIFWNAIPWEGMIRPVPVILSGTIIALLVSRRRPEPATLAFFAFALALLAKIFFHARTFHYGFALAMPATIALVIVMIGWIPARVDRAGGAGIIPRAAALAALAVATGVQLYVESRWLARRDQRIDFNGERFYADRRAIPFREALAALRAIARPADTLVALPEGMMFNYLLRIPSPTRYQNFLPSEMMMYGQRTMLRELIDHPPTYVVLVHADSILYGARFFGKDYAQEMAAWIHANYEPIGTYGQTPYTDENFGIMLLRRR